METEELATLLAQEGLVARAKMFDIDVKGMDKDARTFPAVFSTGTPDRDGEFVNQASVQAAMPRYVARSGFVDYQHDDRAGGIGSVLDWAPVEGATRVVIRLARNYDIVYRGVLYNVDNIWKQIEQRVLRQLSFTFLAMRNDMGNGLFELIVKDMLAVTVVSIPSNADTQMELAYVAKSLDRSRIEQLRKAEDPPAPGRDPAIMKELSLLLLRSGAWR